MFCFEFPDNIYFSGNFHAFNEKEGVFSLPVYGCRLRFGLQVVSLDDIPGILLFFRRSNLQNFIYIIVDCQSEIFRSGFNYIVNRRFKQDFHMAAFSFFGADCANFDNHHILPWCP